MEKYHGNTVEYWKQNAEENYLTTPISVLKYITVLEEQAEQLSKHDVSCQREQLLAFAGWLYGNLDKEVERMIVDDYLKGK